MSIVILGDLHFGARNSSPVFHEYFEDVLDDIFLYIEANGITEVIQLGDLFDDRTHLSLYAWSSFNRAVVDKVNKLGIKWYQLVGNHDSRYRETLKINTPRLRLSDEPNFIIIDDVGEYKIGNDLFLMVPWINKENAADVETSALHSDAKFCCGHFEFNGFEFAKGIPGKASLDHKIFDRFERVYSGHFHTMSTKDNVLYTGTPYELTWVDCNDPKGFVVHDTKSVEWIPTKKTLHSKLVYSAGISPNEEDVRGKFVRVLVNSRPDKVDFFRFIAEVDAMMPIDRKNQENFSDELASEATTVKITETREVIADYLDKSNVDIDKSRLLEIFDELYMEAMMND